jgi:SAM-dependent methyltransferase
MVEEQYCCPRCHGELERWDARYECTECQALYPVVAGIPDFRVYADPYIGLEEDRRKGRHLAEQAKRLRFSDLLDHYYEITPEVPAELAKRFKAHHMSGIKRGRGILERLAAYNLDGGIGSDTRSIDLGCGTGGFLAAMSEQGSQVFGIDIAFRWLVIGQKHLAELGHDGVPLVCACADHLPYRDRRFSLVIAENLLEHVDEPYRVLEEARRIRISGGAFAARTVNRFALAPEPHVGLWGVGFMPRSWTGSYVRWLKGIPYEHIRPQSYFDLTKLIRSNGSRDLSVTYPYLSASDYSHHSPSSQRLFAMYAGMADALPPLRPVLLLFGPYLDIVSRAPARTHSTVRRLEISLW